VVTTVVSHGSRGLFSLELRKDALSGWWVLRALEAMKVARVVAFIVRYLWRQRCNV
jgi:hypothetical protein